MLGLLLLLTFCVHACYTDIREKKIKNVTSFCLAYTGILLLAINVIQKNQSWTSAVICIVVTLFLGFGFYMMGGIGGGDAKFFIGLAFVISALVPSKSIQINQLIPLVLLINTLVVYILFTFLLALSVLPQPNKLLETVCDQISQGWHTLKQLRAFELISMIGKWLSGILTFLLVLYIADLCLRSVGYTGGLLTFLLAMLVLASLNSLWKRLRLSTVWKLFFSFLGLVHLSLNVAAVSLSFKDILNAVVLITFFMFLYKPGKLFVTYLSEKALSKFGYGDIIQGNSSIYVRFAPFLSIGSLLTLWAEGSFHRLFIS